PLSLLPTSPLFPYTTLFRSGKRIRAALVYAAGEAAIGGKSLNAAQQKAIDHCAAAVEMIHAYSLVHDDMPCMDDDVLRRGQPTRSEEHTSELQSRFDLVCRL